jgi:hypothetical protein
MLKYCIPLELEKMLSGFTSGNSTTWLHNMRKTTMSAAVVNLSLSAIEFFNQQVLGMCETKSAPITDLTSSYMVNSASFFHCL